VKALIDEGMFKEFQRVRADYRGGQQSANVLVPVGPESGKGMPAILFVGQATQGMVYDRTLGYQGATQACAALCADLLVNAGRSPFWQAIRSVCSQVVRTAGLDPRLFDNPSGIVGWSNLAKIGAAEGRPKGDLVAAQRELCVEALRTEISTMRPLATVFLSGDYLVEEILYPSMGQEQWRNNVKDEDRVAVREHPQFGTLIWTYHPRTMRQSGIEREAIGFVAGYIAALAAKRRKAESQGK
jgi:hypothetical protein